MNSKEKIESIIKDLMEQLYKAKGFDNLDCNPLEHNIFEAEMKEKYQTIQGELEDVVDKQQYLNDLSLWEERNAELREELEQAEEALGDVLSKNEDLVTALDEVCDTKEAYFKRLQEISKVVNDTWC